MAKAVVSWDLKAAHPGVYAAAKAAVAANPAQWDTSLTSSAVGTGNPDHLIDGAAAILAALRANVADPLQIGVVHVTIFPEPPAAPKA